MIECDSCNVNIFHIVGPNTGILQIGIIHRFRGQIKVLVFKYFHKIFEISNTFIFCYNFFLLVTTILELVKMSNIFFWSRIILKWNWLIVTEVQWTSFRKLASIVSSHSQRLYYLYFSACVFWSISICIWSNWKVFVLYVNTLQCIWPHVWSYE